MTEASTYREVLLVPNVQRRRLFVTTDCVVSETLYRIYENIELYNANTLPMRLLTVASLAESVVSSLIGSVLASYTKGSKFESSWT